MTIGGFTTSRFTVKQEESKIGGEGMELGAGAKLEFKAGRTAFEGKLESDGLLNVTEGKVEFKADGKSHIGGDGLKMEANASLKVERGELDMKAPMRSEGKLEVPGGKVSFDAPERDSRIELDGAMGDIANLEDFRTDFKTKLAERLFIDAARVEVRDVKDPVSDGRRRLQVAGAKIEVHFKGKDNRTFAV